MAEAGEQHCSECDYALEGLPPTGTCPECGCPYDERFVILRGYSAGASGSYATASPWMVPFLILMSSSGLLLQILPRMVTSGGRLPVMDYVLLGVIAIVTILVLLRRWDSSGPPCQLWMCREGYWFRDRISLVSPQRSRVLEGWFALICAVAVLALVSYLSLAIGATLIVLGLAGGCVAWRRGSDPQKRFETVQTPTASTVTFLKWTQAERISVTTRRHGKHLVTIAPAPAPFWSFQTASPVSILATMSPERAAQVKTMGDRWIAEQRVARV